MVLKKSKVAQDYNYFYQLHQLNCTTSRLEVSRDLTCLFD